ncbi:glycosyltransferase family 39 protein [Nonomuraea sp. KM90]|uniref:glycosyltransferase family 39 protein n=1 Tax=Nonomuraea sp. KM90 TaxID=3457428 RepID=UPI003FCE9D22
MTIALDTTGEIRKRVSARHRLRYLARTWLGLHRLSLLLLTPMLAVAGVVHVWGMSTYPRWVDDPGTYLSQAWSVQYEGALSPYSYFYDHTPAGWLQMALWSILTNGFNRYDSAIDFGNECMLIAKLFSCALLFALGRRIGLTRAGSAAAVLLLALSPVAVTYTRWTFLDNLVTPWLLLAFVLAYSPRRTIGAAMGAAAAFALAALTKETALVTLPAFAYAMAQNLDRRNRPQVIVMAAFTGILLMSLYPLFAIYKGELFPGQGHNSLLETASWQLAGRQPSGSVLDPDSPARDLLTSWLGLDQRLLIGALAALPVALVVRRLRPAAVILVVQWLLLIRGGYVPYMHVITLLPWSALMIAGAAEQIGGAVRWLVGRGRHLPQLAAGACAVALAAVWAPALSTMMTAREAPPLRSATEWVADNVPRNKVLVVHDAIWTDLVHYKGFSPRPIIAYKLDTDPAVARTLRRIDYLVVPNWYYDSPDAKRYPTLLEARKHAIAEITFGTGDNGVRIYRVSGFWQPRRSS